MLDLKPLNRILFLDIETTSQKPNYCDLTKHEQELFQKRFKKEFEAGFEKKFSAVMSAKSNLQFATDKICDFDEGDDKKKKVLKGKKVEKSPSGTEQYLEKIINEVGTELYNIKAPIFPEFGKVICISVGVLWKNEADEFYNIKINTFSDEDEKTLLTNFINHEKLGPILNSIAGKFDKNQNDFWALCSHNGRVFDFPFLAKKMIINGLKLPAMFDYAHLKPWEQNHIIDTKETWSFGVWDAAVSLDMLSHLFNTASSKDDIDGSEVKDIFWVENDLPRIAKYCEKDVIALATNYLRMKSMPEEVRVYCPPTQKTEE